MRNILLAVMLVVATGMYNLARADVARGIQLFERGDYDSAAAELLPLVASDASAQYVLGMIYHSQVLAAPDGMDGLGLITAAAEAGYLPAQNELGRIYRTGDGADQDLERMMFWYERAASQGDVGAQLFVADGYAYGFGVKMDRVEAYKWYEIAIRYWGTLAVRAREVVAEEMSDAEIAEGVRRAGQWFAEHPED